MALWSLDAALVKGKSVCFQGILLLGRLQTGYNMKLHEAACPESCRRSAAHQGTEPGL